MPTMTMTVKYVNPPKAGKQRGSIKGADDQILGVFTVRCTCSSRGRRMTSSTPRPCRAASPTGT
jgi:hypothetical protein